MGDFQEYLRLASPTKRALELQEVRKMGASSARPSAAAEVKRNPLLPSLVAPKKMRPKGLERTWDRMG
jgi:hypothetical protein